MVAINWIQNFKDVCIITFDTHDLMGCSHRG